ncbi:MAG: 2-oxo acid dehydrogenase subunit E2 [Actinobacteria bacterium]|nr:2-oxo acid dehydrogenase subunit E2 [Actinomycetota bacterium]
MSDIVMPRLSDSMTEGTVVRWLKAPGDSVVRGEPIVEIETDKATITYEADADGVLVEILVGEGQTVPVGAQIARLQTAAGEPAGAQPAPLQPPAEQPPAPAAAEPAPPLAPPAPEPAHPGDEARVKASPIARRLARKLGVDLTTVTGTGPGGRIVKEDIEAAASAAAVAQAAPQAPTQAPAPLPPEPLPTEAWQEPSGEPALSPPGTGPLEPSAPQPPVAEPPAYEPPAPEPVAPEPAFAPLPAETPQAPSFGQTGEFEAAPPPLTPPAPQPVQPLPGPAPFVPGMTGGFAPVQPPQPGMPQPGMPQPGIPQPGIPQPGGVPGASPMQPGLTPGIPSQPPVQTPAASATATRGQSFTSELTGPQQTVARRMAESKATAPDFYVELEVDMTSAVNHREQLKMAVQPAPSFNDMVIKACALALRQYPKVNAAYKDGHFEQYGDVNVGFAVPAGDLLAMPVLMNADQKGLAQIARESRELAGAVRARTVQPAQLSGGTFSISNLGMYGVDRFTAILNPPQAAILAVGAIKRKPVIAEDGVSLAVRQIMALTLTCDHRILYGAEGAEFLAAIKAWLESPQALPL